MSTRARIEKYLIIFLTLTFFLGAGTVAYLRSRPAADIKISRFSVEKPSGEPSATQSSRININAADADELMALKGVGKVLAGRIVEYRSSNGLFLMKEDIKRVKGIGPALYEKIKDDIVIE
jgi:competence ComEA-like helix-hairpin-helix protein